MTQKLALEMLQRTGERLMVKPVARSINACIMASAAAVKAGEPWRVNAAQLQHLHELKEILEKHAKDNIKAAARVVNLLARAAAERKLQQANDFISLLRQYITERRLEEVANGISQTTRETINSAILAASEQGLGAVESARLVARKTGLTPARAYTIAVTETHTASNWATAKQSRNDARDLGLKLTHEWSTSGDERVRPSHAAVDGTTIEDGQHYTVGGQRMSYPGDPSGGAKETIHCRCVLLTIFQ
jgi:uncharacterized protein with gpF-like domain